ncbi:unnamed protein product [Phytophthora fragariaefolia]|uniref:Unnamed protein product n=1 Tax=Phytophthora fragariaefolia TaxID=1490495 RepID=A0A9W6YQE5_9STRA|nr:unnamed protein product [Phytophthora fragariaefolia]
MRVRLDEAHAAVGLPVLPADGYEAESVSAEVVLEEHALLEKTGVGPYASGSQDTTPKAQGPEPRRRAHVDPTVAVQRGVYDRLLSTADDTKRDAIDGRLAMRLHGANDTAFAN